jgi:hypothetical protein
MVSWKATVSTDAGALDGGRARATNRAQYDAYIMTDDLRVHGS